MFIVGRWHAPRNQVSKLTHALEDGGHWNIRIERRMSSNVYSDNH